MRCSILHTNTRIAMAFQWDVKTLLKTLDAVNSEIYVRGLRDEVIIKDLLSAGKKNVVEAARLTSCAKDTRAELQKLKNVETDQNTRLALVNQALDCDKHNLLTALSRIRKDTEQRADYAARLKQMILTAT